MLRPNKKDDDDPRAQLSEAMAGTMKSRLRPEAGGHIPHTVP